MIVRFRPQICDFSVPTGVNLANVKHLDLWELLPLWQELLLFAIATCGGIWAWLRARQAQSWLSTQGTVQDAIARPAGGRGLKPWLAKFTYTYVVNGEYYSGFHSICARTERRAEELVAGWEGRMVVVRYSPTKHDISVLLTSDQPGGQLGN